MEEKKGERAGCSKSGTDWHPDERRGAKEVQDGKVERESQNGWYELEMTTVAGGSRARMMGFFSTRDRRRGTCRVELLISSLMPEV